MSAPKSPRSGVWTRRCVQVLCLLLFLVLLLSVRMRPDWTPGWGSQLFFLIDPLILLATLLAAHAVPALLLLATVTIVLTAILGRVFCGWVCPLGTLHALAGRALRWIWPVRKKPQPWSPWQRTKYYVLAGFLVMALFGGHGVCVFDPLVLLTRSITAAVLPAGQWAAEEGSTAVYDADPGVGPARLKQITEPPYRYLSENVFNVRYQAFVGAGALLLIFAATLLLNRVRPRFWCRYVCPLGALLGLIAIRPLLRRKVDKETCTECDLCGMSCSGASSTKPGDGWKASECFGCLSCTGACKPGCLSFVAASPLNPDPPTGRIDLSKRALIGSAIGGIAGLAMMRISPQARGAVYHPLLIRPPGSRPERDFLQRCTACGLCMKVCPTGGLQPAWSEAGLEGIWTPRLAPLIGHCDYECNLCGHVCPTEAIRPLTLEEKKEVKIGLAFFDTTRCIPYAYGRDCIVCEEHCPIPDKAIYVVEEDVVDREGGTTRVKRPRVDPDRCVGCGICENVCPYRDAPAIRVHSANETRHSAAAGAQPPNEPILPGGEDPY